ncbi:MAG: DUF2029 domain-containing protein [Actinobacteria bacterium]|nr:DUF2029 domain-containing protein [Actinomycetota bacterium]MBI3686128.1 DUF2029 domain-containing protein [Actinomycetota bacterium]
MNADRTEFAVDPTETRTPPGGAPAAAAAGTVGAPTAWWLVRRWLPTRALTVLLLVPEVFRVFGDVSYYYRSMAGLFGRAGLGETLREYPVPSIGVFALPRLVVGDREVPYVWTFVGLMLLIDGAFSVALWRSAGHRPTPGLRLWLWFLPALGPITLCRLDLVPAVLAGGALVAVLRRPVLAGALVALGTAVKLWPAAIVPALWLHRGGGRRSRWWLLASGGVTAGAVLLAVAAIAGGTRLASPLTWQSDRSLQLESYSALPLLIAGAVRPDTWRSEYTRFFAFEVIGPGVSAMLVVSTALTALAVVGLAVLWLRAARAGRSAPAAPGLLAVGTVGLMIITDKTFSPQYLIWLGALTAALGVTATDAGTARLHRLLLLVAVLTQIVYPNLYSLLAELHPLAVALATLRDGTLVALTWLALHRFWTLTGRPVAGRS